MTDAEFNTEYYQLAEADKLEASRQASKIFNLPNPKMRHASISLVEERLRPFVYFIAKRAYEDMEIERKRKAAAVPRASLSRLGKVGYRS